MTSVSLDRVGVIVLVSIRIVILIFYLKLRKDFGKNVRHSIENWKKVSGIQAYQKRKKERKKGKDRCWFAHKGL